MPKKLPAIKKAFKKRNLIYLLLPPAFLLAVLLPQSSQSLRVREFSQEHRVVLKGGKFEPAKLTISVGDTVTFSTAGEEPFWPASDPHPIHDYLSDFDAKREISVGESWSYTFVEPGTWLYHNHLEPSARGEITVVNPQVAAGSYSCSGEDGECFDRLIKEVVKEEGIEKAYALFKKTYEQGSLPRACHWTAHQIGEAAYELFKRGEDFPITYATSYCGYGFYHGFLESLLRENPNVEYALSFCDKVKRQLGNLGLWNCYHGIGHGFTEDPPDPRVWRDFEAMVKPGIDVCEYLFRDDFMNLNLCLTGVFTVPAGFAEKDEYGLSIDAQDPFALCRNQPYRYQKACYGEFAPKLDSLNAREGWNILDTPRVLEGIKDGKTIRLVTWVIPSVMVARDILGDDLSKYAEGCEETFSGRLRRICWGSTLVGIFTHGEPEKQYEKALQFCAEESFSAEEREFCYRELAHRIRQEYSLEQAEEACATFPRQYQQYCPRDKGYIPAYDDPIFDEPEPVSSWREVQ